MLTGERLFEGGETISHTLADVLRAPIDLTRLPAGTPPAIAHKLSREIARIVQLPDVIQKMATDGSEPVGSTPEQFAAHIKSEVEKWRDLIRKTGIRTES